MKFEIDVNFTATPEGGITAIIAMLGQILTEMKNMTVALDELTAQVAALESVSDSAVTLLTGLKSQLELALLAGNPTAVQAAVQDLTNRIFADTQKLADAVTANTPAQ